MFGRRHSGNVLELSDATLGDTRLGVSVDAADTNGLPLIGVLHAAFISGAVMKRLGAYRAGTPFEDLFGHESIFHSL